MVSLDDHFHPLLDLCQHCIGIAGEIGVADVQRIHIHGNTAGNGGPVQTRTADPYRVKGVSFENTLVP